MQAVGGLCQSPVSPNRHGRPRSPSGSPLDDEPNCEEPTLRVSVCVCACACPLGYLCVRAPLPSYFCVRVRMGCFKRSLPEPSVSSIVLYCLHHLLPVVLCAKESRYTQSIVNESSWMGNFANRCSIKLSDRTQQRDSTIPVPQKSLRLQSKANHIGKQRQHHLDLAENGSSDWLPSPPLPPFSPPLPLLPSLPPPFPLGPVPEPPFDPLGVRFRRRLGARANNNSPSPSTQHFTSSSLRQTKYPEPFLPFLPPRRPRFSDAPPVDPPVDPRRPDPDPRPDSIPERLRLKPNPVPLLPLPLPLPLLTPPHLLRPPLRLLLDGLRAVASVQRETRQKGRGPLAINNLNLDIQLPSSLLLILTFIFVCCIHKTNE